MLLQSVPVRWRVIGLILLTFVPLLALTALSRLASGGVVTVPLLADIAVATRFLVAGPILLYTNTIIRPRALDLFAHCLRSGLVSKAEAPKFEHLVERLVSLRDSRVALALMAIAVVFGTAFLRLDFAGDVSTWQFVTGPSGPTRSAAGWWYLFVSVPVFQFLLLLWIWRYTVWCWFLFRFSRMDLVLVPTHPDRSAGLAVVGYVHQFFAMIAFALSAVLSAHVGVELLSAGRSLFDYGFQLGTYAVLSLIVLFGPLMAFTPRLVEVRRRGLLQYGSLAARYTREFDRKWIRQSAPDDEPLLGSSDIQSLADLANSFAIVSRMRVVPFGSRVILVVVSLTVVPFLPLAFSVFSALEVITKLIEIFL